ASSLKMRRGTTLSASQRTCSLLSVGATPRSTSRPCSMAPTTSSATTTRARRTRCKTARMGAPQTDEPLALDGSGPVRPAQPALTGKDRTERVMSGRPAGRRRGQRIALLQPEARMADFTPYQQKVIKRYYDNQDALARQRLAELVSDLYLTTGKKRQRV